MAELESGDHWVYFGDGNAAQIIDSKEYIKSKTSEKMIRFMFKPSKLIEETYDIQADQDPQSGYIIREYPEREVVFLQRGTFRTRCWIFLDFLGRPTMVSRRSEALTMALKDTERLLKNTEAAKNRAYAELEKERTQQMQSLRTKVEMVREVARARQRMDLDGEGSEMEEAQ